MFLPESAKYGLIARNELWNANAAHWFDDIKQVIFEHNTIRPGGAFVSWGNNLDNYGDGYAQHVYSAYNSFQNVWQGDREIMTFDPVTGHYMGPVLAVDKAGTTLTLAPASANNGTASNSSLGGAITVLAGAGAGQYRRIIRMSDGTHVTVDRPFSTPLDATSRVTLGPFKGRIVFHANEYRDGGSFQTYGNAQDVVVSEHRFARCEALLSWGRANPAAHAYCPNTHIEFVGNVIEEANHMWNSNGSYPYPHPKTIEPYYLGILGSDQDVQVRAIYYIRVFSVLDICRTCR